MHKKHLHILLTRFFENDFPREVQKRFGHWFSQEKQMEDKDEILEEIWNSLPSSIDFDSLSELKNVNKQIRSGQRNLSLVRRLVAGVAIILLPFLGVFTTMHYYDQQEDPETIQIAECYVPYGEQREITLPDGTTVWLNAGSILLYPEKFGKNRSLYLSGEGIFNVTRNPEQPFIVKTNFVDLEVLGTVFNIQAYPDEKETITILESGSVQVSNKTGTSTPIILQPNEQLIYNHAEDRFTKNSVDASRLLRRIRSYMTFQQETIGTIFRSLERKYDVKIHYNDTHFKDMTFTVSFHGENTLEESLEILKRIGKRFNYTRNDQDIYIQY